MYSYAVEPKKPQVPADPRPGNKKAMGALPCPPMALDAHLCTGLPTQPKGVLQKKKPPKKKAKRKPASNINSLLSLVALSRQIIRVDHTCQVNY